MRIILLLLSFIAPLISFADKFVVDGIRYETLAAGKVGVIPMDDNYYPQLRYQGDVKIPSTVTYMNKSYAVVQIGEKAFYDSKDIKSLLMPNSIKYIDAYAFYKFPISELTLSSNLVEIGENAFSYSQIQSIVLPNTLKTIGDYAFFSASKLTNLIIPNSVTSIGSSVFDSCEQLVSISFGAGVETIGMYPLIRCYKLSSICVAEENKHYCAVDDFLFSKDMTSLISFPFAKYTEYDIPEGVITIEPGCFDSATKLTRISFPSTLRNIGTQSFGNCTSLSSVILPEGIHTISSYAFWGCQSLKELVIGSQVQYIHNNSFDECNSLETITCNAINPPSIESNVFSSTTYRWANLYVPFKSISSYSSDLVWSKFENINPLVQYDNDYDYELNGIYYRLSHGYPSLQLEVIPQSVNNKSVYSGKVEIPPFVMIDGHRYDVTSIAQFAFSSDDIIEVILPESIKLINSGAFYNASNLLCVQLDEGLQDMGDDVFAGCSSLVIDRLPESLVSIGGYCFDNCNSITSFSWPASITKISKGTFNACRSLTSIYIPETVTNIHLSAFGYCSALKDIYAYPEIAPLANDAFYPESSFDFNSCTLHIHSYSLDSYKASETWSRFLKIEPFESGINDIKTDSHSYHDGTLHFDIPTYILLAKPDGTIIFNGYVQDYNVPRGISILKYNSKSYKLYN